MLTELTEETAKEFIKDGDIVVVKGHMDGCSLCDDYAPIFTKVAQELYGARHKFGSLKIEKSGSEFKRNYMKAKPGEPMGAPCTFIFENGELKTRYHGLLTEPQLKEFIKTQIPPAAPKPRTIAEVPTVELKAMVYDNMATIERLQMDNQAINTEISKRQQAQLVNGAANHAN